MVWRTEPLKDQPRETLKSLAAVFRFGFRSFANGFDKGAVIGDDLVHIHRFVIQSKPIEGRYFQPAVLDGLFQFPGGDVLHPVFDFS